MSLGLRTGSPPASHPSAATIGELARLRASDSRRRRHVIGALLALLLALSSLSLALGAVPLTITEIVGALQGLEDAPVFIVTGLRGPRAALALLVGATFGIAGALLQAVVRNPLASPDIVGLTGGASAAAVLAIAAGASGAVVSGSALLGALTAAATVFLLSGRDVAGARFVVIGIAVAFLATGILGYALTRASLTTAQSAFFWLVGSVGSPSSEDLVLVLAVLLGTTAALVLGRRQLGALALDDDTARSLGAHPVVTRVSAILLSSVLAAISVAVAGPIAFVAFVAGPVARRLRGGGSALGTAALVGACLVLGADLVAQHLLPGQLQPPVGLVTGAIGAPFLVYLLIRGESRKETTP